MSQGFVAGGWDGGVGGVVAAVLASVRRSQDLPPCWTHLVPAGSDRDPSLAKAEPISDAGGASILTYITKGKKYCAETDRESSEKNERQIAKGYLSVKKEREEMLQALEKIMVKQIIFMELTENIYPHRSPCRTPNQSRWICLKKDAAHRQMFSDENCSLWRTHEGSSFLTGTAGEL